MADTKPCRTCGKVFEVGGRGHPHRRQIYCSHRCHMLARVPIANPGSNAPRPKGNWDTLHNEAWLRARYLDDRLGLSQIAALVGVKKPTVQWAMRKFDIPTRSGGEGRTALFDLLGRRVVAKAEMVAAYGGACACCGEKELVFLSLDHIDGAGAAHRRSFGDNAGRKILQELKAAGWPTDKYRVLCMNCQFGTRFGRTCPHQA